MRGPDKFVLPLEIEATLSPSSLLIATRAGLHTDHRNLLKIRAVFAAQALRPRCKLGRNIFLGKLATARTYAPSFQKVARQERHMRSDALA